MIDLLWWFHTHHMTKEEIGKAAELAGKLIQLRSCQIGLNLFEGKLTSDLMTIITQLMSEVHNYKISTRGRHLSYHIANLFLKVIEI